MQRELLAAQARIVEFEATSMTSQAELVAISERVALREIDLFASHKKTTKLEADLEEAHEKTTCHAPIPHLGRRRGANPNWDSLLAFSDIGVPKSYN